MPALQGGRYAGQVPVAGEGFALIFAHEHGTAYVAWADAAGADLELAAETLWQVTMTGERNRIRDGGADDRDGEENGRIRLRLSDDPVILWLL